MKLGDAARGHWIEVRKHNNHLTGIRTDRQIAIHSGHASADTVSATGRNELHCLLRSPFSQLRLHRIAHSRPRLKSFDSFQEQLIIVRKLMADGSGDR
jgi:hypothetical protein